MRAQRVFRSVDPRVVAPVRKVGQRHHTLDSYPDDKNSLTPNPKFDFRKCLIFPFKFISSSSFDHLMSEATSSSWAGLICEENYGQHRNMVVQTHLRQVRMPRNSLVDVRVSFSIPSGVYLDVFELYARHDFGWNSVFIHTASNDVDYESVRAISDAGHVLIALEFIGVPSILTGEDQYCHIGEDQTCTVPMENALHEVNVNFSLPLHFRYQHPIYCKSDTSDSSGFVEEIIESPSIYVRINNNTRQDFAAEAGANKRTHWLYSETKLGNKGNYAPYYNVFPSLETYTLVDTVYDAIDSQPGNITFRTPTGCMEDINDVVHYTCFTMVFSSLFLLLVLSTRWCSK